MLKGLKNVIQLIASLLCVFSAVAVMVSDTYNIDLYKSISGAFILTLILGSIPFLNNSGAD